MRLAVKSGVRGGSALDRLCPAFGCRHIGSRDSNQLDCGNVPAPVFV